MKAPLLTTSRMHGLLQPLRFLIAGGVNTLVGYGIYLAGLAAGLAAEVSLLVATVLGALWNYQTTARFVFGHKKLDRLPAFILTYALIYIANMLLIRLLLSQGLSPQIAQAVLLLPIAAASFLLFRFFVFSRTRQS